MTLVINKYKRIYNIYKIPYKVYFDGRILHFDVLFRKDLIYSSKTDISMCIDEAKTDLFNSRFLSTQQMLELITNSEFKKSYVMLKENENPFYKEEYRKHTKLKTA